MFKEVVRNCLYCNGEFVPNDRKSVVQLYCRTQCGVYAHSLKNCKELIKLSKEELVQRQKIINFYSEKCKTQ